MSEKIIYIDSFNKNSIELIKVNLQEWKGQMYVDMVIWHLDNPAEIGAENPTNKGITMSTELLLRLLDALQKARETFELEKETK